MKKTIVILAIVLINCSCQQRNSGGRYKIGQNYKMINGITIMRTVVVSWERGGIVGDEIYDNTITLNSDSVVYYKEVERIKAEAYRVQWFKINRPGIEPVNLNAE